MRTLIVTAADAKFFPLLQGLLSSLHQWPERPFADIAVLDLGLLPEQKAWVTRAARHITEPGWDLPVSETAMRANNPFYRAVTARPFLPRYFPGYDIYLWMDADTWAQERFALDICIAAAADGSLAAVPETHPSYQYKPNIIQWRMERMTSYFGAETAKNGRWDGFVNSGFFALRANAPHWELWAKWLGIGLETSHCEYFSDQTALNYAAWTEGLPVTYLPARCNWLCHLAMPFYDRIRQRFCEASVEARIIGVLHLSGEAKDASLNIIPNLNFRLTYPGPQLPIETEATPRRSSVYKGISF